ncbi:MAG: apolipoprotein N-acyltransferase [Acidobacteriales bacterium]|nr:apolipoprotein N-acyltransferase [Terriglobales bacterium]
MNQRNTRILLASFSGLLQALIFPNASWTWLSWIALAPLLYALLARPSVQVISRSDDGVLTQAQGFWIGYASGIVWYACSCYWVYRVMHLYGGLSAPIAALMLLLFCMYLGLYHGLFGALIVRCTNRKLFSGTQALILVPVLWVAVELARARVTGFPWDLLGTAQVDSAFWTPLIATRAGVYGLSFVIAAINAMVVGAILSRGKRRLVIAGAALVAVGLFEGGRAVSIAPSVSTHVAVLVQQNIPLDFRWTSQSYDATMAKLADETRRAAKRDDPAPRLIVWPESPSPFYLNDPKFHNWMSTLAADRDAFIIAGSLGVRNASAQNAEGETLNSAALIAPSGAFVSRYDKVHLVPFGEYVPFKALLFFAKNLTKEVGTFSAGTGRSVFNMSQDGATESVGPFICYESVFPDEIREFAANGAQVFVNISNDGWFGATGAARQHLNMARMRAIENQRWVLRSTNTGITASIDPYGRVVAAAEPNVQTSLRAKYSLISETTFYTRHGDWFAIACAIISVMVLFVRFSLRAGVIRGN